jgi:hypothetical protein
MNEEINRVKVVVINSNTGHIVRSEALCTDESLLTIVQRYSTKDSIVTVSIDNTCYCFYIKDELYIFSTSISVELIEFFKDVLEGLYDNARDSFHIQWGRVATLCQQINDVDYSKYEVILNSIDNIWGTRYYSRFLRRGKND